MGTAFAPDAEMVLGIASTAMPFARTPEDAAERWLRILRLHGEVGSALRALGVSEGPLSPLGEGEGEGEGDHGRGARPSVDDPDAIARVTEYAVRVANERGARGVATTDVLMAVMHVYGANFDRVLQAHGTDRDKVIERLGTAEPVD